MAFHPTRSFPLAVVTIALAACGGGGTDTTATGTPGTPGTLSCDSTLFSSAVTVPTSAQLAAYAKTYSGDLGTYASTAPFAFVKSGTASLVFKSDGTATYNGSSIDLKSVCFENAGSKPIYLHWGTKTVVGAGAVYDNHMDLFADGTFSGQIGTDTFQSAP